ncbi:Crp/Fnr family transcriptional regulator [Cohaesibacter celericrescens]|uniref:Crp/Fnr family transcriptional regulator n=1 Tax=Cohaesibacter celericrescens TaxID=2067669 RepID=A0A2N5XLR1_9HYPH|nr:Crp/Fnr family transcriptional regulator [Cohaesibacter celericrescens]PLW75368.1 hypothetical protein C0081_20075 [Cohaesibacter celericrescens]
MAILNIETVQMEPRPTELMPSPTQMRERDRLIEQKYASLGQGAAVFKPRVSDRLTEKNDHTLLSLFAAKAFEQHFQPNSTILLHGYPADAIYLIVSGTIRCNTISEEGTRQIFRFAKKGELVGISDIDIWHFTAEAVDHVIVKAIPRAIVEQELSVNESLRHEIRAHICSQLECREKQLLSLVTSKAPERLFRFLCEYASSRTDTGYIALPMCRRDIADHLGTSVETVSRAFSELKAKGRIDLATAEKYKICDEPHNKKMIASIPQLS